MGESIFIFTMHPRTTTYAFKFLFIYLFLNVLWRWPKSNHYWMFIYGDPYGGNQNQDNHWRCFMEVAKTKTPNLIKGLYGGDLNKTHHWILSMEVAI